VGLGSGAVRAGRAFVELFGDDTKLTRALESSKRRLQSWAGSIARVGAIAGGAGGALFAPLLALLKEAASRGAALDLLSKRTGSSVESLATLAFGAEKAGVSMESFGGIIKDFEVMVSHAADANEEFDQGLKGLTGRMLIGKDVAVQLDIIAERIKNIPIAADRLRAARSLGLEVMLPYLEKGKAGLDELRASARDAGAVLSPDAAEKSATIMKEFTATWQAAKYAVLEVGYSLVPTVAELATFGQQVRDGISQVRQWISQHRGSVVAVAALAVGLIALGVALAGVSAAASLTATVFGGLLIILKAVLAVVGFFLSPIGLVLAAVVGLGAAFVLFTDQGRDCFNFYKSGLLGLWDTAQQAFGGIADALKAGNFTLAFKVGAAAINLEWKKLVETLTVAWIGFKMVFVDGWRNAVSGLKLIFIDLAAFILRNTQGTLRNLLNSVADMLAKLPGTEKLVKSVRGAANRLMSDDQINAARDQVKNEEMAENAKENAKAAAFRLEQYKKAQEERQLAQKAFDDARKEAADAAEQAGAHWAEGLLNGVRGALGALSGLSGGSSLPTPTQLFGAAKGLFSVSDAQSQLGLGDSTARRQLDAQLDTAKNTAVLPEMKADVNALTNAMRYK